MTLLNPFFGEFGGMYVPQILVPALLQLEKAFIEAQDDPAFHAEFRSLLTEYAGRPTPRITSYNVCYTKLLRPTSGAGAARSCGARARRRGTA